MALTTRRQFVRQAAFATAAAFGWPGYNLGAREQNTATLDSAALRKLTSKIRGRAITLHSPDYDSARTVFNRAFDLRPLLIVRCTGPSDVVWVLDFARRQNLPLAVRGGGHSRAGFGVCDGGVVIDFSEMRRVEVDAAKRIAIAEAGAMVSNLDAATQKYGLATTSGGCPTVGIAGLTLGGGEGLLQSMYGAACDNLLSAPVVSVDGHLLEASLKSNPDLFWAIRGGGGNFGVVTELRYQLHPVGEVFSGALTYQAARIPDMLGAYLKFVSTAPDEMVAVAEILRSGDGPKLLIHVCYFGGLQRANDLLAPFRTPIKPLNDDLRVMPYLEAQAAGFLQAPFAHFQTNLFVPNFKDSALEKIITGISNAPPQFRVLIVPFSGAITRVPLDDMAFALRRPGFEVDIAGRWSAPAEKADAVQWVKSLRDSLQTFAGGVYVNQMSDTSEQLVKSAYGANYRRLAEIKKKYDPANVLRLNQNIAPA